MAGIGSRESISVKLRLARHFVNPDSFAITVPYPAATMPKARKYTFRKINYWSFAAPSSEQNPEVPSASRRVAGQSRRPTSQPHYFQPRMKLLSRFDCRVGGLAFSPTRVARCSERPFGQLSGHISTPPAKAPAMLHRRCDAHCSPTSSQPTSPESSMRPRRNASWQAKHEST